MIETNIPDINVDELMEKIRAEVRQRKERGATLHRTVPHANDGPRSNFYAKVDFSKICAMPAPEPFEYREQGYHINDFLKYHDQQFVMNAYRGILMRGPDSGALQYFLENLRSGKMTKAEILGRLRYAPEGRKKMVRIRGLFWNFVIQSSFRIPVLGYFSRLTVGIGNLPLILRNLQVLEESLLSQLEHQRNDLGMLQAKENEFIDACKQLRVLLDQKADREAAEAVLERKADREAVEAVLERKADREAVEAVLERKADREELEAVLERKADREAVEAVLERKADREELEALNQKKVGLEELVQVSEVKADLKDVIALTEAKVNREEFEGLKREARDLKLGVLDQQHRLRMLLAEARKSLPEPISTNQIQRMLSEEDHMLDAMYVSLEDRERGTRQNIKQRSEFYLPYIQKAGAGTMEYPLVDVGCGRGEWIELLKENGFIGRGVDMNRVMQRECQELGLDVVVGDAVEFLRGLKPNSLGAVTGFHIVEHLPIRTMLPLFSEALRVLKPGGIVIFETPNPENIFVGSCTFYSDPTHRNPIPPNTLSFLIEYQGFINPEIVRLHPLNYIEYEKNDVLRDLVYRFNMGQDYAVIARKAS